MTGLDRRPTRSAWRPGRPKALSPPRAGDRRTVPAGSPPARGRRRAHARRHRIIRIIHQHLHPTTRRRPPGRPTAALDTDIFAPPTETKAKKAAAKPDADDGGSAEAPAKAIPPPRRHPPRRPPPKRRRPRRRPPRRRLPRASRSPTSRTSRTRPTRPRRAQGQRHVPAARDHHLAGAPPAGGVGRSPR